MLLGLYERFCDLRSLLRRLHPGYVDQWHLRLRFAVPRIECCEQECDVRECLRVRTGRLDDVTTGLS
jgi:hypothetical protein